MAGVHVAPEEDRAPRSRLPEMTQRKQKWQACVVLSVFICVHPWPSEFFRGKQNGRETGKT